LTLESNAMLDFKGVENFHLILTFVVPGVISLFVRSRLITGRTPSLSENLLAFLVLSLVYYSLIVPFLEWALSVRDPRLARAAVWISLVLIGPAIFGLFLGVAAQKEWIGWIADKLNLNIVHVIPTAWDWRFSKTTRGGMFIMVTLKSGEQVAGLFGSNSFASSDSGERDLFIEEEYDVDESGQWQARHEKVGVLISQDEVKFVEFWQP
jgi:hypothetical protein